MASVVFFGPGHRGPRPVALGTQVSTVVTPTQPGTHRLAAAGLACLASSCPGARRVRWRPRGLHGLRGLRENAEGPAFPVWSAGEEEAAAVQQLIAAGQQLIAGARATEAKWTGLWRVAYAPHMRTLGGLGLTKFDVYYDIAPSEGDAQITSFVRFEGPLWQGWLNASGSISSSWPQR